MSMGKTGVERIPRPQKHESRGRRLAVVKQLLLHSALLFVSSQTALMADTRPLSSGLAGCCKAARLGGGLPASEGRSRPLRSGVITPRPWLPPDLLRFIDALARRIEREERLRTMNGGVLGQTLVHAATAGGLRDVRFLLAAGADANSDDGLPLLIAAHHGHMAVMTALLDAGARKVEQALVNAVGAGQVPAAALLLVRGVNIHYRSDLALRHAACFGQLESVAFLLDNGADAHAVNDEALYLARRGDHAAVEALLLERAQA